MARSKAECAKLIFESLPDGSHAKEAIAHELGSDEVWAIRSQLGEDHWKALFSKGLTLDEMKKDELVTVNEGEPWLHIANVVAAMHKYKESTRVKE